MQFVTHQLNMYSQFLIVCKFLVHIIMTDMLVVSNGFEIVKLICVKDEGKLSGMLYL
jgi:hypothetical protein